MAKTEKFALGMALMSAGLGTILRKEYLAWGSFYIGVAFMVIPFVLDWVFGDNRPSRKEIELMSGDDYKKLLLKSGSSRYLRFADSSVGKMVIR